MKLPRDVSGERLARVLIANWGYLEVNRVGSHIILQTEYPAHHRLSVPAHSELRVGTLNAILRDVARVKNVSRDEIIDSL
jgi:predicted RNA binding protein YcfA (HicA-like mRNA interferase family)